ncbi:hypothetical protein VP01_10822g1, partial [Puccinia sorghi]
EESSAQTAVETGGQSIQQESTSEEIESINQSLESERAPKEISRNTIMVHLTETKENDTPMTYIQVVTSAQSSFWKKAIEKEVTNMYDHDVWVIVPKSGEQKPLNCTIIRGVGE